MITSNHGSHPPPADTRPPGLSERRKRWLARVLLAIILLVGLYFRTLGLYSWDEPSFRLHPDERFMIGVAANIRLPSSLSEYIDSSANPLNPRNYSGSSFYVYGLLPQTITRLTAVLLTPAELMPATVPRYEGADTQIPNPEASLPRLAPLVRLLNPGGVNLADYYQLHRVGRTWSVLYDLGSIVLVFLLGRRMYGRRAGLLGALLLALSVLPIQLAHFFTVDAATAFFTLLAVYWAVRVGQDGGPLSYLALGVSIGAAMACRVTMAALGLAAMVAVAQRIWANRARRPLWHMAGLVLAGVVTVLSFRMLQPDAFVGALPSTPVTAQTASLPLPALHGWGFFDLRPEPRFVENIRQISLSVSGEQDSPPSVQWAGRTRYWFSWRNMVLWGMGLPLGLAGWLGWLAAGWLMVRRRALVHMVLWAWVGFYFLWQGGQFGMTMRYYALLYGLLALFAAWGLLALSDRAGRRLALAWPPARRRPTTRRLAAAAPTADHRPPTSEAAAVDPLAVASDPIAPGDAQATTADHWPPTSEAAAGDPVAVTSDPIAPGDAQATAADQSAPGGEQPPVAAPPAGAGRAPGLIGAAAPVAQAIRNPALLVVRWLPAFVVLATLLWAYAFTRIYTEPHSRIAASRWIYDNVPPGSAITSEEWDDGLPLNLDGRSASQYVGVQMKPFGEDDETKYVGYVDASGQQVPGLLDQIDQADYIILSSNRVYDSISRQRVRYPVLMRYYSSLFSGELGFEQVADITSYPRLFGIAIPDQTAEEAFSVYDHPRVLIFRKTAEYSRERAEQLITEGVAWSEVYKLSSLRGGRVSTALRLTEAQWPAFRASGTWLGLFNPAGLANQAPWLFWLLALELLGLAAFPLLFRLLPRLPDRGFALAKTLGLLLVAYAAWLLASLNLLSFTPLSVWLCALLLVALGGLVGWRSRAELLAFARARRAGLIGAEALFLLAFLGFVLLRALNPDLWHPARGGEKPMDLAFLTAVLKSASFPPYDPWFAGGYINYYYFGFVLVGALVHLTGVVPTTAYNLAVPTVFALTALGAWGVAYNLVAGRRAGPGRALLRGQVQAPRHERRALASGLVAAVFVTLLGNLSQAVWFMPGSALPADPTLPQECVGISSYAAQQQCRGRSEWAFWDATRIVGMALEDSTITEFPFFTFLFGDLHAHMVALPLALAALGLMVALLRGLAPRPPPGVAPPAHGGLRARLAARLPMAAFAVLALLALTIGALRATNTWDYPTYLGLGILTLGLVAREQVRRRRGWRAALLGWAGGALALLVLSSLLFWPFLRSFATDYAGFELWTGARTPIAQFLEINGLWLFLLLGAALLLYRRQRDLHPALVALIGVALLALALVTLLLRLNVLLLLFPLALLTFAMLVNLTLDRTGWRVVERAVTPQRRRLVSLPVVGPTTLLPVLWGMAGLGLLLICELLVARGDIGRMNTVFKLGMQVWVLFGLASAVGMVWVWQQMVRRPLPTLPWCLASLVLVGAALVYPLTATPARLADRYDTTIGPTLDGAAYMRSEQSTWAENNQSFPLAPDADAIEWMRRNIDGTPIVLEAQTEGYRWGGRVSIYTGLPTLIGWPWHETQQRSVALVEPVLQSRRALVDQIYSTADPQQALGALRQYGVEYVYVGGLERALYDPVGLAKFDTLVGQGQVQQVYANGETRIYRLAPGARPPALLTTSAVVAAPALPPRKTLMLSEPVDQLPAVDEFAWNPLARSQPGALLVWLLACYALLLLGLPLAVLVFGRWRDGGYAWARLIGLLLLGYAVWLPVSARLLHYDRAGLALGALLVLLLDAALLVWLGRAAAGAPLALPAALGAGLRQLGAHLRAHRRSVLLVEGLFLAGFGAMTAIRALNPDLWQPFWGGEKPFEFAFLNAIMRSPVMPPYNPFFSGGTINYYYYGLFLVSLPAKAAGVAPAVAFNLIIPTLFGMLLGGAFALVQRLTGRVAYGLLGAAAVALFGNLATPLNRDRMNALRDALSQGGLDTLGQRLNDWFVWPSRVIPETINEFPFWSFLFADLHPHLIALPITLLAAALAYVVFEQRPALPALSRPIGAGPAWLPLALRWGLVALTLGALAATNSWDFPTYALLLGLAALGAAWREGRARRAPLALPALLARLAGAGLLAVLAAGAGLLLYLPFFQNFEAQVRGIGAVLVQDGTRPYEYALLYGVFLAVLLPVFFGAAWRVLGRRPRAQPAPAQEPAPPGAGEYGGVLGFRAALPAPRLPQAGAVLRGLLLLACSLVAALLVNQAALGLQLALALLTVVGLGLLLARRMSRETWFALCLAVVAWMVSLGIELIYIRDHLAGGDWYRMNTVFKFGMQIWVLLALAAAALLPRLLAWLRRQHIVALGVGAGLLAGLLGLALVYPLVGVPSRVAYRFSESPGPTLDGLAFMDLGRYDWNGTTIDLRGDADAIRWLNQNISGTPVVLQSSMEFYRAYGVRVAANTGLPTVVSPLHESEQRDPQQVADRDNDVIRFYSTADVSEALQVLARYRVGYVYVGPIERAAYGQPGMDKFDQMRGAYLELVFNNEAVQIYRVSEVVYSMLARPQIDSQAPPAVVAPAPEPSGPSQEQLAAMEQQYAADPTQAGPAFMLAQAYAQLGRLSEAADTVAPAAAANSGDVALHHLWGDLLRQAGRYDEAESAYRQAVAADPNAGTYNKLGVELIRMERYEAAIAALNDALAADASVPDPYYHMGDAYERLGQPDQARASYQQYLERAPADAALRAQAEAALARLP